MCSDEPEAKRPSPTVPTASFVDRDSGNPHPVTCNGVHALGAIYEDKKPQHLTVQVTGGNSTWRIAVISGNRQS